MDIKREEGDSSGSQLREEPPTPLTNSMTSNAMKMTTLESSRDSSLSSVRYDLIKNEDDVSHSGSAQPMRTRQTSRLATATLVSSRGANPEVPPQVRSDVEHPQSKGRATTTHHEPSSEEDLQEDYAATEVKRQLRQARAQLRKQNIKLSSAEQIVRQLKEDLKKEREKVKSKRDEYQKKIKSGPITMGDDGQMRTLLARLGDMCKDWAAKYAIPDEAGRKYNDVETSNILNLLKLRYDAVSDHGAAKIFHGMTNCAELLLNTALTHLVWFEILNRPFYFVEHAREFEAPTDIEEGLKWLVQLGDCCKILCPQ
jgi:FtsZ-binding cell division protein ZapB